MRTRVSLDSLLQTASVASVFLLFAEPKRHNTPVLSLAIGGTLRGGQLKDRVRAQIFFFHFLMSQPNAVLAQLLHIKWPFSNREGGGVICGEKAPHVNV